MCRRTPAMPIFFPHHHLLVLFSSREEGNSLAEAEAALSTRVVFHLGAQKTNSWISYGYIYILTPPKPSIKVHSPNQLTWCASLLPLPSPSSPRGCLRPSGCVGPCGPLRLVMGQGSFRYSDTTCRMQDTSSGIAMPSASRICHLNPCYNTNESHKGILINLFVFTSAVNYTK